MLGDYFGKRPVVLALVYYDCPMLCTQVLNGLVASLNVMSLTAGKDFDVVAVSFDPRETPAMAAAKKNAYLSRYKQPGATQGWHFLTGDARVDRRADAGGRASATATTRSSTSSPMRARSSSLTPEGRLARYFYGIEYAPRDLRLGLVEASAGKIGTPVDRILLYCFHYDPKSGKYGPVDHQHVRLAGAATVVLIAASIGS